MAHVISSLRSVQERLLASWQTQQAAAKTRQQAAQTDTSRATTSFRALFPGKAVTAALSAMRGIPLAPAQPAVATALPAMRGRPLAPAQPAVAAALPATQGSPLIPAQSSVAAALPAMRGIPLAPALAAVAAAADAPAQDTAPTAQSVFGPNPWIANPTGSAPDGSSYNYNPMYFATAATAAQVAQMVGGRVVASDQIASAGGFAQQQPNQMVQLANGTLINAGLVASFYTHGYPQSYIDRLVADEVGASAT